MDQDTLRFLLREAVREMVTEVLQTALELDRTAFPRAHGGRRNGYYPRKLETTFGQVDLKVPRDREGQYYPALSPTPAAWWTWGVSRRLRSSGRSPQDSPFGADLRRRHQPAQSRRGDEFPLGPPLLPRDPERPHGPGSVIQPPKLRHFYPTSRVMP